MSNSPLPSVGSILQSRATSPVLFALVGLFFFFTFCEISCNNQKIASMTGVDLVTGSTIDLGNGMGGMFKDMNQKLKDLDPDKTGDESDKTASPLDSLGQYDTAKEVKPNLFAILALIAALIGLVLSFVLEGKTRTMLAIGCGAFGAAALLVMQITMNSALKKEGNPMMPIDLNFKFPYWGAFFSFVLAALIAWWQRTLENNEPLVEAEHTLPPVEFGPPE